MRFNFSPTLCQSYVRETLRYDFLAGFVVFLIAIPLCLGIALISGAPLFSGVIAGTLGGMVVGALSQSAVSVSGPGNTLTAVVLVAIGQLGGFDHFLLALTLAGLLQIVVGFLRAGFVADYIPQAVVQGLLSAVGILIVVKQLPLAFSHTTLNVALMQALKDASDNLTLQPLFELEAHINLGASIISLVSIAILIYFDKTKNKTLKAIPGPVVVVILGVLMNEMYQYFIPNLEQFSAQLVNIPVSHDLKSFLGHFQFPAWEAWRDPKIYWTAITLMAIASLETLLNLEAAEQLDDKNRYCSRNTELIAQGVGNTLSGLIGGLPITSVVVRSSVNIQMGAKTKGATIIHGLFILIVALFIPHWLNAIPLASLAAILIYVGYKLTRASVYKKMYSQGLSQFTPFIITIVGILFANLLLGILLGLFASFFFILRNSSRLRFEIIHEKHPAGIVRRIILPEQLSFLRKAALIAELDAVPADSQLIIDGHYIKYIDQDILALINEFTQKQALDKNISINLIGFKERYAVEHRKDFINVTTYDVQSALTPAEVLSVLKEGNQRFLADQRIHRNLLEDVKATSETQHPIAVVLGCIDSRVPVEAIFDVGVGDVFVARVAGNVVNEDMLASMEFACAVSGAKLIIVLGHTCCGAIKAAYEGAELGHLKGLLQKIKPAVAMEKQQVLDNQETLLLNITKKNAENTMNDLYQKSSILRAMVDEKKIGLVSAIYDVATGVVSFDVTFVPL